MANRLARYHSKIQSAAEELAALALTRLEGNTLSARMALGIARGLVVSVPPVSGTAGGNGGGELEKGDASPPAPSAPPPPTGAALAPAKPPGKKPRARKHTKQKGERGDE